MSERIFGTLGSLSNLASKNSLIARILLLSNSIRAAFAAKLVEIITLSANSCSVNSGSGVLPSESHFKY